MKNIRLSFLMFAFMLLGATACGNNAPGVVEEMPAAEVIPETEAGMEFDSLSDFWEVSEEPIATFQGCGTTEDPELGFHANVRSVLVEESYIKVDYDCTLQEDSFRTALITDRKDQGAERWETLFGDQESASDIQINGQQVHELGSDSVSWWTGYALLIKDRLVVLHIEKGYEKYLREILLWVVL